MSLPNLTFVIHDIEGGVASMNHQILENAEFRKYFSVHILLWRSDEQDNSFFRGTFQNADSVFTFRYSKYDNYYQTLKKFNAELNKWPGTIVTNDGMELESIRKFGTPSVVFSIVHDFYNLKLAIENIKLIDYFICHTETFYKVLISTPSLRNRVAYLTHGVKIRTQKKVKQNNPDNVLSLVSISRLIESKGVSEFYQINQMLSERNVQVNWKIVGTGELEEKLREQWKDKSNVEFLSPLSMDDVYDIAESGDIFISPSIFEGYGIALLEAMSCGLVPVINQLPIGIYSGLPDTVGFSMQVGDLRGFADSVESLHRDRQRLQQMSTAAGEFVKRNYNIKETAVKYLEYIKAGNQVQSKEKQNGAHAKLGLLDQPFVPNMISRSLKKARGN